MSAALGALALLLAAFLPGLFPRVRVARRGLAGLGVLALLPAASASGAWPFVLLAAAAAVLATPLPLVLAAAGAVVVALRPEASAPVAVAVAALAAAVAADGLDSVARARHASGADSSGPVLAAGLLLALVLAVVDGGTVLSWSFGVGTGVERAVLSGVGVVLGAALVAVLGGVLLVGGAVVAPPAPGARTAGQGALAGAVVAAALGIVVALARLASLPEGLRAAGARPLALLVGAAGVLALCLIGMAGPRAGEPADRRWDALSPRVAAALALVAASAAGVESWWRDGTYATTLTAATAAVALLGLASLEPVPRLGVALRLLFLAAVLALVLP